MNNDYVPYLRMLSCQLSCALFYMRNSVQVAEGSMLFHKDPGLDTLRRVQKSEEGWHAVVQVLMRRIEQVFSNQKIPRDFSVPVEGMAALYERKRKEYLEYFPQRYDELVTQRAPDRVDVPILPVRYTYGLNGYTEFYRDLFNEVIFQVDAYRWMCELDRYAYQGASVDMPPPFEATQEDYTKGWAALEHVNNRLMQTLVMNNTAAKGARDILAQYGYDITVKLLGRTSDRLADWLKEMISAGREARVEKVITCDDVVPGLEKMLYDTVVAQNYSCQIGTDLSGRVPEFPKCMREDEFGQAWLVTESNMMGSDLSDKNVIDFLFYAQRDFDYKSVQGFDVSELDALLIEKTLIDILMPLQKAGQIHTTYFQHKLSDGRVVYYSRIFRAEDFPCSEHPETLLGQPLGQYHCPACGEMQMAGCFHLPREFDDEGNPTNQQ